MPESTSSMNEQPESRSTEEFPLAASTSGGVTTAGPPVEHRASWFDRFTRVPLVQRVFFTENLRVMIRAGLPLGRALKTLTPQVSNKHFRRVILEIRSAIESGVGLSNTLARYPYIFPEFYVAMIAAGETSGKLDEVLVRLASQMKKEYALRAKIRNALMYPTIVIIAMIAVAIIMLVAVLPKITAIFAETKTALPLPTRILIGTSNFLLTHYWLVLIGVVALIGGMTLLNRRLGSRRFLHRLLLRLPIVGPILRKIALANFSRSLSSLLSTDIPIVQTFHIIAKTMTNLTYRESILRASEGLKTGSPVVKVLELYPNLFPPIITQMVAIGEESGTLDSVAGEMATFYEEDVDQTMTNLSTVIEPVIILLLGLGVAAIAVAVILPIYSLGSALG